MEKVKVSFDVPKCYLEMFNSLVSMSGIDGDVFFSFLVYYACVNKSVYEDLMHGIAIRTILDYLSGR